MQTIGKIFSPNGKLNSLEFFKIYLATFCISCACVVLLAVAVFLIYYDANTLNIINAIGALVTGVIFFLLNIYVLFVSVAKRLRDMGSSLALMFIPILSIFILPFISDIFCIFLMFCESAENKKEQGSLNCDDAVVAV